MERLSYSKKNIELLLNTLNTLIFSGFDSANKLSTVFQILNSPIIDDEEVNEN